MILVIQFWASHLCRQLRLRCYLARMTVAMVDVDVVLEDYESEVKVPRPETKKS